MSEKSAVEHSAWLQAFLENRKECYFQPFYSIKKRCIWGAEALLRLYKTENQLHNTEELVRAAEKEGWVSLIDKWMFLQACEKIPTLRKYDLKRVNLNFSADELERKKLVPRIAEELQKLNISRCEICIEITETSSITDSTVFQQNISDLKQAGIRLAMDDFGKGESNLLRIMKVPFATLKLDKEVVWEMNDSRQAEIIVEEMITIAHRLGVQVTAEGVETKEQALTLKSFGCDYLQGYFISKPLSYEDFILFLQDNRERDFLK